MKVNTTSIKNERYTHFEVSMWIHSDSQKKRRSVKAITETPIPVMTQQA